MTTEYKSYDGLCMGGPRDGQRYVHWLPVISMEAVNTTKLLFSYHMGEENIPDQPVKIEKIGEYVYTGGYVTNHDSQALINGVWIWRAR